MVSLETIYGQDGVDTMHSTGLEEPEACIFLQTRTFTFPQYFTRLKSMHEMREWLFGLSHQDKVEIYQYYKLQLQIMAHDEGICKRLTHKYNKRSSGPPYPCDKNSILSTV